MIFVRLRSSIRFWSEFRTHISTIASTLSTFASNRPTPGASFTSTLSAIASNMDITVV